MDHFHSQAGSSKSVDQKTGAIEDQFSKLDLLTTKKTPFVAKTEKKPIVIINFWASWCLPCLKEFPSLLKFQEKYKDKVSVIGINGDEEDTAKNILKIEKKFNLTFESVMDADSKISDKFFVVAYPTSLVFLKGKLIFSSIKAHDFMDEDFIKLIETNLK